jgi:hypothetical protein
MRLKAGRVVQKVFFSELTGKVNYLAVMHRGSIWTERVRPVFRMYSPAMLNRNAWILEKLSKYLKGPNAASFRFEITTG